MRDDEPVVVPIDGELDLHTFNPREVKPLLGDYLAACREKGILSVRVVHGKGVGTLRQTVHGVLDKMAMVESYRLAGPGAGDWGATLVVLKALK